MGCTSSTAVTPYSQTQARDEETVVSMRLFQQPQQQEPPSCLFHSSRSRSSIYDDCWGCSTAAGNRSLWSFASVIPSNPSWLIPRDHLHVEVSQVVGSGSFGHVFRGEYLGSTVAIKCVEVTSEVAARAFLREVAIWQQARHPNVVRFFGACPLSHPCALISEEAANGTLPVYLRQQKQADRFLVWRTLLDAALGLRFLHQRGIIHDDLKGNNILVSQDGTAMLNDFGLSSMPSQWTLVGSVTGAVRWMAPECMAFSAPTFESDLYSFGMVIVEAVTGKLPWTPLRTEAIPQYVLRQRKFLRRQREFESEAQWELVRALCAFEPGQRLPLKSAIQQLSEFAESERQQEQQLDCDRQQFEEARRRKRDGRRDRIQPCRLLGLPRFVAEKLAMAPERRASGSQSEDDEKETSAPSSPSNQSQQVGVISTLSEEMMATMTETFEALYEEHPLSVAKLASRTERREREFISMSLVYGEIAFAPFKVVLDVLKRWHHVLAKPGGVFLDIGSGSGKAVFAATLLHDFDACVGIEVLEGLHTISQDVLQRWEKVIKPTHPLSMQKKRTRISFTLGDALVCDWPPNADLVFLNSTCFGERLMSALTRKLALCCKPGAVIITATHELPDTQNFEKLRQLTVTQEAWGDATWYLHRKK
ncbi:hypothetical protein BBJ28_00009220 [Nothophytophthora sp. Chile5]|nr:hypothetical protein BBJ28_00009220 [Nothophytophthora sp. Chile5]